MARKWNDEDMYVLSATEAEWVREALVIGLKCLGEIEERCNAYEIAELSGIEWPEESRPIHPTGTPDNVSKFATALGVLIAAAHRNALTEGAQS